MEDGTTGSKRSLLATTKNLTQIYLESNCQIQPGAEFFLDTESMTIKADCCTKCMKRILLQRAGKATIHSRCSVLEVVNPTDDIMKQENVQEPLFF